MVLQFVKDQTKHSTRRPVLIIVNKDLCTLHKGVLEPHPGARPEKGAYSGALGGWAFTHGFRPGPATTSLPIGISPQRGDLGLTPVGQPTARGTKGVQCCVEWIVVKGWANPWLLKLSVETWMVTSLVWKEFGLRWLRGTGKI